MWDPTTPIHPRADGQNRFFASYDMPTNSWVIVDRWRCVPGERSEGEAYPQHCVLHMHTDAGMELFSAILGTPMGYARCTKIKGEVPGGVTNRHLDLIDKLVDKIPGGADG